MCTRTRQRDEGAIGKKVPTVFQAVAVKFGSTVEGNLGAGEGKPDTPAMMNSRAARKDPTGTDPDAWAPVTFCGQLQVLEQAIACSTTAILKVTEQSPATQLATGEPFRRAGVPPGVMNAVTNAPKTRRKQSQRGSARLRCGICRIIGPILSDEAQKPFGGVKDSGDGRFGKAAVDVLTAIRWLTHEGRHQPCRVSSGVPAARIRARALFVNYDPEYPRFCRGFGRARSHSFSRKLHVE